MRLGGPVFEKATDPDAWAAAVKRLGYGAAYCPLGPEAGDEEIAAYASAAAEAGIVIAEVGAWSSPVSNDADTAAQALAKCQAQLALAEKIGARCCVNVSGSRGANWAGPCAEDLTDDTFDRVVETVRAIIDAVRPTRTFYTIEMMQWMIPDSPDNYVELLEAVDRERFAVHLDPVNLINSPPRFFANGRVIDECFDALGPHIKSCHAKDVALAQRAIVHLDEVRPGLGGLDYRTYLRRLDKLAPDTPLMIEHLRTPEEYTAAADHIRSVAEDIGTAFR